MRAFAVLVALGIVGVAPEVLAEGWRAKPVLEPGAPPACQEADVSNLFFVLANTSNELSVKTSGGEAFSAFIAPDGSVGTTFTIPVGRRNLAVNLTGNVKTREMEVFNKQYSCRFRLTQVQ